MIQSTQTLYMLRCALHFAIYRTFNLFSILYILILTIWMVCLPAYVWASDSIDSQSPSTSMCFWLSFTVHRITAKKTSFLSMFILPWHLPLLAIIWITFFFSFMFSVLIHLVVPGSHILILNCDFSTFSSWNECKYCQWICWCWLLFSLHTVASADCYHTTFLLLLMVRRALFWNNGRRGWDQWWFNERA